MTPTNAVKPTLFCIIAEIPQDWQHGAVARAKVVFGTRNAVVAVVPGHVADVRDTAIRLQELGEVRFHTWDILVIAGR